MPAAILVIDIVNDTFAHDTPLARATRTMCVELNAFLEQARKEGHRVVFSTDSFLEGDFLFKGRMNAHSIRGTKGAEVATELDFRPEDVWLPKRRFSAFFKTGFGPNPQGLGCGHPWPWRASPPTSVYWPLPMTPFATISRQSSWKICARVSPRRFIKTPWGFTEKTRSIPCFVFRSEGSF